MGWGSKKLGYRNWLHFLVYSHLKIDCGVNSHLFSLRNKSTLLFQLRHGINVDQYCIHPLLFCPLPPGFNAHIQYTTTGLPCGGFPSRAPGPAGFLFKTIQNIPHFLLRRLGPEAKLADCPESRCDGKAVWLRWLQMEHYWLFQWWRRVYWWGISHHWRQWK